MISGGGRDYSTPEADNLAAKATSIASISSAVMDDWLNKKQSVDPDNPNNSRSPQNRNFLGQTDLRSLSSKNSGADTLDEIMAAPEFRQPMYEPLQEMSQNLLLPGVSKIPPNTLALLETNRRFVESYLVGCNHEFAAELLWRRYPTDQRGSFFRQFWDVGEYIPKPDEITSDGELLESVRNRLRDISQIHTWGSQALGANYAEQPNGGHGLFLLIRGDLLRRYPSAVIYTVESVPKSPTSSNFVPEGAEGQDFDSGSLNSTPKDDAGKTWDGDTNSATLADLTLQRPVRVVRHASQMIHSNYLL